MVPVFVATPMTSEPLPRGGLIHCIARHHGIIINLRKRTWHVRGSSSRLENVPGMQRCVYLQRQNFSFHHNFQASSYDGDVAICRMMSEQLLPADEHCLQRVLCTKPWHLTTRLCTQMLASVSSSPGQRFPKLNRLMVRFCFKDCQKISYARRN